MVTGSGFPSGIAGGSWCRPQRMFTTVDDLRAQLKTFRNGKGPLTPVVYLAFGLGSGLAGLGGRRLAVISIRRSSVGHVLVWPRLGGKMRYGRARGGAITPGRNARYQHRKPPSGLALSASSVVERPH